MNKASWWTHLGLVLYPVRCLLELADLPDDVRDLRGKRGFTVKGQLTVSSHG